jgi:hypothetical protein
MPNISASIECDGSHIVVGLPLTSHTGKIRVKRKEDRFAFGREVATRQSAIDERCYIEWQIGYDNRTPYEQGVISKIVFFNRGEQKFAFELSTILYMGLINNVFPTEVLKDLLSFANTLSDEEFIEESSRIARVLSGSRNIKGLNLHIIEEKYPLYFLGGKDYEIEIIVRHRQRAGGYQAMVYVCLPIQNAETSVIGRTARSSETINFKISQNNNNFVYDAFRVFALASRQHNEDIKNILSAINGVIRGDS